jgi:multiple sugar transport system permease protein
MAHMVRVEPQALRQSRSIMGGIPNRHRESIAALGFLLPGLLIFILFSLGPALFSLVVGFTKWNGLGAPTWVGIDNYSQLLTDSVFQQSLWSTLLYTVEFVVLVMISSTVLALLLNSSIRGRSIVRFLWFVPFVTDMVSVSMVWTWIYHTQFGVLNYFVELAGMRRQAWLGDPDLALFALVILSVWRWTGYYSIIILAGLQAVPRDLYEAAILDGANRWQMLKGITLPLVSPALFFVLIISMMSSFQVFEQMWVMTRGGPEDSTISVVMYLYIQGFQFLNMGYASAIAWVLFLIIFSLTVVNWVLRKVWVYEG